MSVVRGRPPGLAGGIIGTSRAYCSSLRACPAPKSPTKARLSAVHMTCLQQGCPLLNADPASVCPSAHPSRIGFSNGLLAVSFGRVAVVRAQQDVRKDALDAFRLGRDIIARLMQQS